MIHFRSRIVLLLQVLLLGAGTLVSSASARRAPALLGAGDGPLVVRVYVRDKPHLDAVAGELDIWEAHPEERYVVAGVTREQLGWLRGLGYAVQLDPEGTAALAAPFALDPRYYYFDQQHPNSEGRHVVDFLRELNAAYPNLTELIDVGDAWMASKPAEPDRDIWVLRVTNEDAVYGDIADKPAFFLAAAMHAREVATAEVAIRHLRYLTAGYEGQGGYGEDADVTWLVDHHVAYVLVMQNPDGHAENERDRRNNRRKNVDWDDGCSEPQFWGVDLNRNHSFFWGCCAGSSGDPCAETYRGPQPGSEPETAAFEGYFASVMEDQNGPNEDDEIAPASPITTTGIFVSLHSYGDLVLWPWAFDSHGSAPNHAQLRTIGRKLAYHSGYRPSGTIWYDADGTVDDWTYGTFGVASFTLEVGPQDGTCGGFFPPYECIDGYAGRDFWAENLPALLYAHKIAGAPYRTAYGPDVAAVRVAVPPDSSDGAGRLAVTLADQRCCGDVARPIAGAEYFLDIPGEDGAGTPMEPVDGAWGGLIESVQARVPSSALADGRHLILVHAQNDQGCWGPLSAVFAQRVRRTYFPLVALQWSPFAVMPSEGEESGPGYSWYAQ